MVNDMENQGNLKIRNMLLDTEKKQRMYCESAHFKTVIEWVQSTFPKYYREMKGINWGQLYDKYSKNDYNDIDVAKITQRLYDDVYVKNPKGIFEYVLRCWRCQSDSMVKIVILK